MNDEHRRRITLERTYSASLAQVWALWTTARGIESWWGPDGFAVTVRALDLRPGGKLRYAMTAIEEDKIAFMKRAGMPVSTEATLTYTEVIPRERLAYVHLVDFVPGVGAYDVATQVTMAASGGGVRMALSFDAMHDEMWTNRATMGWESELGKLGAAIAAGEGLS